MSTPPPGGPPSGFPLPNNPPGPGGAPQYVTPPGGPNRGSGGCLKAAGITCGVLFLIAAIGFVWVGVVLRNAVRHPGQGGGFLGAITGTIQAVQQGQQIQKAVVAYHVKNKAYPRSLPDLVTDGETDGRAFHSSLDPNPSPAHISWRYYRPAEGAPGTTRLLLLRTQLSAGSGPPRENDIVITLDGGEVTPGPGGAPGASGNAPPRPAQGG